MIYIILIIAIVLFVVIKEIKFQRLEFIPSNNNLSDYLPIGSIIKIKDKDALYMIYNYGGVIKKNNKRKEIDYWCVSYPLGFVGNESNEEIAITHDEIDKIIFVGYDSQERRDFINNVIIEEEE